MSSSVKSKDSSTQHSTLPMLSLHEPSAVQYCKPQCQGRLGKDLIWATDLGAATEVHSGKWRTTRVSPHSWECIAPEFIIWSLSRLYPGGIYFHSQPIPFGHQCLFGLPIVLHHCSHGTASASISPCSLHLGISALLFHVTYCASCI